MTPHSTTHTFFVHGMHCKACVLLTESEVTELPEVTSARSDLATHTITVEGDFLGKTEEEIASLLSQTVKNHGYTISLHKEVSKNAWSEFLVAIPAAILFLGIFLTLQKLGIVNLIKGGAMTYGTAFVIGVVASLSTCMAVVGGLLLSMSATFAKGGATWKPQALFHLGRLTSFFLFGGIIGLLGSAFTLSANASVILGIIIALVMLILGVNLLDVFPLAKRFQLGVPRFLSKYTLNISQVNSAVTPFLVGVATFFLPCGFTQSMQVYTLSTGNFVTGAMTMTAFALGTFPVLALISFGSFSLQESRKSGIFFKSAGLVVIVFALFNLMNSMVVAGILPPLFNF
jgi:sulfite exporter TauE/SafE/copper chaperone CopZ